MLRPLRALAVVVGVAVAGSLTIGPAGAEPDERPAALANEERRQALLHRHWPTDGVPGSLIVTAATPELAADVAVREGGRVIGTRSVLLHVEPGTEGDAAARLLAGGGVVDVEPDRIREPALVPNDPLYGSDQWSHRLTNVQTAWDTTTGDGDVTVAVLDTGVDGDHPDLLDNLVQQVDLSSGRVRNRAVGSDNDTCDIGHGTLVSGVIGAIGNNASGVAGVAWDVSIVDVALTSAASRCGILDSAIIEGLEYVTSGREDGPVDVVNLSIGGLADACTTSMQVALDAARDAGVLVVASSGNAELDFPGIDSIPASCNGVMSIGAIGEAGEPAVYSTQNDQVDLAAPGGDTTTGRGITTTAPGGGYLEVEGTSFASPYVAGVAALLRSVDETLTPDDLESILESTASDRGSAGRDPAYGWGLVDVGRAVQAAVAGDPEPPVDDDPFPVQAGSVTIERVARAGTTTEAIAQAVALSRFTFSEPISAVHAVIARSDDYADALAGSALGFGLGPLLFTRSTGSLAGVTANELERVLEPGSTVYLLGGTAALPATLEGEIAALGFEPVRIAGANRMETAVAVAEASRELLESEGFTAPSTAIVATAFNWPDAVAAGSLAAWFGMPILVTSATVLDEPIADYLDDRDFDGVYVVGGTAAISEAVRTEIRELTGLTSAATKRLAGPTRSGTAVAIAEEFERIYTEAFEFSGVSVVPAIVAGVNLRRDDGFAHVLSASALIGAGSGVFVPIEGDGGTTISDEAQSYACRYPAFLTVVVGGEDLVSDDTATLLDDVTQGRAASCTGS